MVTNIIGWNLVRIAYTDFVNKYTDSKVDSFPFSKLYVFHYL